MSKLTVKRYYREVFFIKPNTLGNEFLDNLFHKTVPYLKNFPFVVLVPLSFVLSLVLLFLFGKLIVSTVSLFQYGF